MQIEEQKKNAKFYTNNKSELKKAILKTFAVFTGKHLCWGFLLRPATQVFFSCEYYEIFKNTYFEEHLPTAASGLNKKHDSYYDDTPIPENKCNIRSRGKLKKSFYKKNVPNLTSTIVVHIYGTNSLMIIFVH